MSEHLIKTLVQVGQNNNDSDKYTFIGACQAEGDLVVEKGLGRVVLDCPVANKKITVDSGVCQETSETCEWHL